MAITAAAIIGGVGLVGDLMSSSGQQQTNEMSMAMMQENQDWQKMMSDTAMQRRVADYKAAGLNPVLAAGGPGAMMGSPVMPTLQNPQASFGNMGAQASQALSSASSIADIRQKNAQSRLIEAQTPGDVVALNEDGSPDWTRATGGTLGNLSAASMSQSIKNAQAAWESIQKDIQLTGERVTQQDIQNKLSGLTLGQQKALYQAIISQGLAESRIEQANVPAAEAGAKLMEGNRGVVIKALQTTLGIAGQAVGMAPGIGRAIGAAKGAPDIFNVRLPGR